MPSIRSRTAAAAVLPALVALSAVATPAARAEVTTFGSNLQAPATLNTADNLPYAGTDIATISNNQGIVVHVSHDGADTALWNTSVSGGNALAPASGQVTQFRIKGCANAAPGGPAPLTQVHFQDLKPTGGGAYQVALTSGGFDLPVCGAGGVDGNTVSAFDPINLCVAQGDSIVFNDEGGFEPHFYPAGVRYQVIGQVPGSSLDSFIRSNATMNGNRFVPGDKTSHDGFATQPNAEVLLQATLATGPDALPICGGTKGYVAPAAKLTVAKQTERISRSGVVPVAVFCHATGLPCKGTVSLSVGHLTRSASVDVPQKKTAHVKIHFGSSLKGGHPHSGLVSVMLGSRVTATQTIKLKG
ncbi:MAG: hypothetical protein NVSMB51_06270 [Solirubrobacteraceae bacterium]